MVVVLGIAGVALAGGSVAAAFYMLAQAEFAYVHAFNILFSGLVAGLGFIGLAAILGELKRLRRQLTAGMAAAAPVLELAVPLAAEMPEAEVEEELPAETPAAARAAAFAARRPAEPALELPRQEIRRGLHVNLGQRVRTRGTAIVPQPDAEPEAPPLPPARPAPVRPAAIPLARGPRPLASDQAPAEPRPLVAERPSPLPRPRLTAQRF